MINRFITFFVPSDKRAVPDTLRRYKLIVSIFFITALFNMDYMGLTIQMHLREGTYSLLLEIVLNLTWPFVIRAGANPKLISNVYVFFGVMVVLICMWFSGGFSSPVLPWLATSPIVALLMAGRSSGWGWCIFNSSCIITLGLLSKAHYPFPIHYDRSFDNYFYTNCFAGLVLITFAVTLVFENGKNTALKRLAESSLLLAEEKKKTALLDISQEIHDNVGQTLSVIKLNLHLLEALKEKPAPAQLQDTMDLLTKAIQDLRNISRNLYAENIQQFNLLDSLRDELELIARTGMFQAELATAGEYTKLDARSELVLFRIIKEALNNCIRHAHAKSISIGVRYEPYLLILTVADDGIGFSSTGANPDGMGLRSMQDRAQLLGAQFSSHSTLGKGTLISVKLPLTKQHLQLEKPGK
jgi:signal transduction histidine kinase